MVISSDTSGAGSRFSSGLENDSRLECSEDYCLDSSGAGDSLHHQILLGMAGKPVPGGYSGWAILMAQ